METVDKIYNLTKSKLEAWKNHSGYAPAEASAKLNNVMFDWIIELTASLKIWDEKGISMTDGELILASANIGALVECMMKLVLSVYILDYYRDPILDKEGKVVQPEKIKYENLKKFCFDKVWQSSFYDDRYPGMKEWVGDIQEKRNSIHAFNKKDLGYATEFCDHIEKYWMFINMVFSTLPDDPYFE